MTSIEIIEDVFKVSFPPHFKKIHKDYLNEEEWRLYIYNFDVLSILNADAVDALNTSKAEGVDVRGQAQKFLGLVTQEIPALKDLVPFAAGGLFSYFNSFLAFKRSGKNIEDEALYYVYSFTDSEPVQFNIRKVADKYSDIIGDETNLHLVRHRHPSIGNKRVLRASDHTYSHLFDRYVFLGGYLDSVVRQLNQLFETFDDIQFSHENEHTLYCAVAGEKTVIFKEKNGMALSISSFDGFEETVLKQLRSLLADRLQGYTLHHFVWKFFVYDIAPSGLGLTKDPDIETKLRRYGMLFEPLW